MTQPTPMLRSRREILRLLIGAPLIGGALFWSRHTALPGLHAQELPLTPECLGQGDLTVAQTEGPYFMRSSPERTSMLEPTDAAKRLVVHGFVFAQDCQPLAGALLDFWQADGDGAYDNAGYRYRGHQFTDAEGRFHLETTVPGLYPGRTRHIHVKVQAPGGPVLTTQVYFAGEPGNARDGIYRPELAMTLAEQGDGSKLGRFDFVIRTA